MSAFVRGLAVELLKTRRTPALMVTLVAPYVVILIPFFTAYSMGDRFLTLAGVSAFGVAAAQMPRFSNLQVIPEDVDPAQLLHLMKLMTRALVLSGITSAAKSPVSD